MIVAEWVKLDFFFFKTIKKCCLNFSERRGCNLPEKPVKEGTKAPIPPLWNSVIEIWGELRVSGWPQLRSGDKEASETELILWEKNEKGRRAAWPHLPPPFPPTSTVPPLSCTSPPTPPRLPVLLLPSGLKSSTKGWEVNDRPFFLLKNFCSLRDLHWILVDRKQSPAIPPCRTWGWRVCRPCWLNLLSVCIEA